MILESPIQPFRVDISDETLADLGLRLQRTRWPDEVEDAGWDYGIPLATMQELVAYWQTEFDWRAAERWINGFDNYRTTMNGLGIHFIHERGKGPAPLPLLLAHGWPSTVLEYLDLIPLLTDPARFGGDPADAFDVVVPSLPGHGFSDRQVQRGFEDRYVGELFAQLMSDLGYEQFGAHGYDIGASVLGLLCLDIPERVIGYHSTAPSIYFEAPDSEELTMAERDYLALRQQWGRDEAAYAHVQGTKPQTLAYGLNDSPAGLAAWILDKWYTWTAPPSGDITTHFSRELLFANVMTYWVTETINSANRYYHEPVRGPKPGEKIAVPMGISRTATQPTDRAPREWVERQYADIRFWRELGLGGHMVAAEAPAIVAEAIRDFFRPLR